MLEEKTISGDAMSLEAYMVDLLERGEGPTAEHFGGLAALLMRSSEIARSDFAPEFMSVVVAAALATGADVSDYVADQMVASMDDVALNEMIDTMTPVLPLNDKGARRAFDHLLVMAMARDRPSSLRVAALRGALLLTGGSQRRLAKFVGELGYCGCDDDTYFLAHAVRIAGIVYATETAGGLHQLIADMLALPAVADQSHFELGMINFRKATTETDPAVVLVTLTSAETHFEAAARLRASRYDARAFGCAVSVLRMFHSGEDVADLATIADEVGVAASNFYSYNTSEGWAFDQSRSLQLAALTSVARTVAGLASSMLDPIWLEGARIIEEELLVAYCANRTVIAGSPGHGLDVILRPRIESGLRKNGRHAAMVDSWLQRFVGNRPDELAALANVVATGLGSNPPFIEAGDGRPPFSAVLERLRSSGEVGSDELASAIERTVEVEAHHTSDNIQRMMGEIGREFVGLIDFVGEARGRYLMICWKLLLFLEHRLDATASQDPTGAYLFHVPGRKPPLEKELQADALHFLRRGKIPSGDEIRGVGGGRADIEIKIDRHRFVIEVKRELGDASFDNLMASYGDQAKTYQATNVKLGFLFALDLAGKARGTPDIETCMQVRRGVMFDDDIDRGLVLLRMPGNRLSPSALSA